MKQAKDRLADRQKEKELNQLTDTEKLTQTTLDKHRHKQAKETYCLCSCPTMMWTGPGGNAWPVLLLQPTSLNLHC